MPFVWSKVLGGAASAPAGSLNIAFNTATISTGVSNKSLFVQPPFPDAFTCGQVILVLADRLASRLGAPKGRTIVTNTNDTNYSISLPIGRDTAAVEVIISSNCSLPITSSYTKGTSSGEGKFQDLESLLRWLTQSLRR